VEKLASTLGKEPLEMTTREEWKKLITPGLDKNRGRLDKKEN
tara:strand:+ start:322 stop:447 length:126 start_codon:yes stop_codon:yes gene_type:complete